MPQATQQTYNPVADKNSPECAYKLSQAIWYFAVGSPG
jgi:hypothetical protein